MGPITPITNSFCSVQTCHRFQKWSSSPMCFFLHESFLSLQSSALGRQAFRYFHPINFIYPIHDICWEKCYKKCLEKCLNLSGAGVWRLSEQPEKHPSPFETRLALFDRIFFSQPHISPRLRCPNRKITKKLLATCLTCHLFWLVFFPSCCPRQGTPLWN